MLPEWSLLRELLLFVLVTENTTLNAVAMNASIICPAFLNLIPTTEKRTEAKNASVLFIEILLGLLQIFHKATAAFMLFFFKELPLRLNFGVGFQLRSCFGINDVIFCRGVDKVVKDGCNQ